MRTQKETDLQAQVVELQDIVEVLEDALWEIRIEPGNARDCRNIAGQALVYSRSRTRSHRTGG